LAFVAKRSATARSKQMYALRKINCAFCRPIVSGEVLAMLIRDGKLPDREPTDVEIDRAVTAFLFEHAGENKFSRVQTIMRDRWHPEQNQECRR
jgi:hypothetical protein